MAKKEGIISEGGEMEALVAEVGGTSTASPLERLSTYSGKQYRRGQVCFLLLLFACSFVLISRYEEIGEWFSAHEEDVESKPDDPDRAGKRSRWGLPDFKLPSAVSDWFRGDGDEVGGLSTEARRSLPELIESLSTARTRIDEMIKADYGEYSHAFSRNQTMTGTAVWSPSETSLMRMKRRMKMKIIESQLRGGGEDDENEEEDVKFTWVTGGHSASAAHGDLLEQSYDAKIQTAAGVAFDAVDVKFRAKHYGMGTASSPELSFCMDEIYGRDIDILNWDFGMTDGRNYWFHHLWVDQAGLHPTFPILFANDGQRKGISEGVEKRGQGSFHYGGLPRGMLPDSETHPDPSSLPPGVAYMMCGGKSEQSGVCKDKKFDTKQCNCRGKVSWHPGWKDHLFVGRFLAMFLVENLVDAVKEMRERDLSSLSGGNDTSALTAPPSLSREYLNQLSAEEEADKQLFLASNTTNDIGDKAKIGADNWKRILRGNPICHSLRLPNQARFDGIMDGVVATEAAPGGYYSGVNQHFKCETLPKPGPPSSNDTLKSAIAGLRPPWMVSTDQEMRKPMQYYGYQDGCNLTVIQDFRDGFVVRHADGWMGNMYPSDAELEAFSRGKNERDGFILMCDTQCMFSNCQACGQRWGLAKVGPDRNDNVTILIDDKLVTQAVPVAAGCYYLAGEDGNPNWGPGTKDGRKGQFEIKFKLPKPGAMVISSLIVV